MYVSACECALTGRKYGAGRRTSVYTHVRKIVEDGTDHGNRTRLPAARVIGEDRQKGQKNRKRGEPRLRPRGFLTAG